MTMTMQICKDNFYSQRSPSCKQSTHHLVKLFSLYRCKLKKKKQTNNQPQKIHPHRVHVHVRNVHNLVCDKLPSSDHHQGTDEFTVDKSFCPYLTEKS